MRIFKNGVNVRWLAVLFVGIVLGIGLTAAYPTIGDPDSYFGNLHGDGGNLTSLSAAQIVGNFTQRINFSNTLYATGLTATSGSDEAVCKDATTNELTINTGLTSCAASTKKVKENIETLKQSEISPEKFNALRPVKFNIQGESKENVGLIAEEVVLLYPQVIGYGKAGEIRGINYEQFIPILIEKVQAQDAIINQQSIMMNRQAEAINALQNEIKMSGNGTALTPLPTAAPKGGFWSWLFG